MKKEDLYDKYIKVENEGEFKAIQAYLFGLNLGWNPSGKNEIPYKSNFPYILIYEYGMGRSNTPSLSHGFSVKDLLPNPLDTLEMYDILKTKHTNYPCIFVEYGNNGTTIKVELINDELVKANSDTFPKEYISSGNMHYAHLNKEDYEFIRKGIPPKEEKKLLFDTSFNIGDRVSFKVGQKGTGTIVGFYNGDNPCATIKFDPPYSYTHISHDTEVTDKYGTPIPITDIFTHVNERLDALTAIEPEIEAVKERVRTTDFSIGDFIKNGKIRGVIIGFNKSGSKAMIQLWRGKGHTHSICDYKYNEYGEEIVTPETGENWWIATLHTYKKYPLRFRTKEEFIEKYGEKWRGRVPNSFPEGMDVLFGKPFEGTMVYGFPGLETTTTQRWSVSKEMLTWRPLSVQQEEAKPLDHQYLVGKQIKVLDPKGWGVKVGDILTVTKVTEDDFPPLFRLSIKERAINGPWVAQEGDFEVMPEVKSSPEPNKPSKWRYKVGDIVWYTWLERNVKITGVKSNDYKGTYPYELWELDEHGQPWAGSIEYIEDAHEIEEKSFTIGDLVRHIDKGFEGVIVAIDKSDIPYNVSYTSNGITRQWWSKRKNLEHIRTLSEPEMGEKLLKIDLPKYMIGTDPYQPTTDREIAMGMAIHAGLLTPEDCFPTEYPLVQVKSKVNILPEPEVYSLIKVKSSNL